ncbi:MAG: thioredoxin family protein [Betaproteobacteria bacterium]|nr:MAG: thioredoxin family protein [Betaproteobacteria bacterium]
MKRTLTLLAATLAFAAAHAADVGKPAPDFTLTDVNGKTVKLADFKGKHVVLEWTNPNCPFVVKHYGSSNMQTLQKDKTAKNVVWLSVNSTSKSHADYMAPGVLSSKMIGEWKAAPTGLLMDESGAVGKSYQAKTTPHMYVIDPKGTLVFAGGIDDKRSANPADIKGAKNFVRAALDESMAGRAVSVPTATPYGCSIKYS